MQKKCLSLALVILLMLTGCADSSKKSFKLAALKDGDFEISESESFTSVCNNNGFELMINGSTTEIAVKNNSTGNIWYSQPADREEDTVASGTYADLLSSPLNFSFVNKKAKNDTLNTYSDSIAIKQYTFDKIENGVRVNYLLGESRKVYIAPEIVSIERFEEILSKLDATDQIQLKAYYMLYSLEDMDNASKAVYAEQYPILKKRDVYIISGSRLGDQEIPQFLLETIEELFIKAGYTEEMLEKDNEDNLVADDAQDDYSVSVSIEYTLDNENLLVRIPMDSINYDQDVMTLLEMSVLPFFGAAGTDKNGYLFIPDGCGALIYLNSNKSGINAYEKAVYGKDAVLQSESADNSDLSQIYLPVFGIKEDNAAFLGIIESGAANADICAQVSGKETSYNQIYSKIRLRDKSNQVQSIMNLSNDTVYQNEDFPYDIQIRYIFLEGESADYTGMAKAYTQYLEENGTLTEQEQSNDLTMYFSAIATVPYTDNILGFPIESAKSLTSYSQLEEMTKKYLNDGVSNLKISYKNWCNGGLNGTLNNKVKLISALGNKKELNALLEFFAENNVSFYPQFEFQYVADLKGFNVNKKASRNLSNMVSYDYTYSPATLKKEKESRRAIVSPSQYSDIIKGFIKDYSSYDLKAIFVDSCGEKLNSDYNEKKSIYRQQAAEIISEQLNAIKERNYSILVGGANDYTLKSADVLIDVPLSSSGNYMLDEDVPFYQMVVRGHLPYASAPINKSGDYKKTVLKLIEYAEAPSFEFIYEDSIELSESNTSYYSVNFDSWYEESVAVYKELNEVYEKCRDSAIVKHSKCAENVYCTEYDNGVKIYTNYNLEEFTVGDVKIPSIGYIVAER